MIHKNHMICITFVKLIVERNIGSRASTEFLFINTVGGSLRSSSVRMSVSSVYSQPRISRLQLRVKIPKTRY